MDDLGDRMKLYEAQETGRKFMPGLPVYARIDGRNFSRFTSQMQRPYDERMTRTMVRTATDLLAETHAKLAYTQSDEISLVWFYDDPKSEMFFAGKVQKMCSVLASLASAHFIKNAMLHEPGLMNLEKAPAFDCRVIQLPNLTEAANMILWRELDACKNAVSMAARHYYSSKTLMHKNSAEMQEMLFSKGVNFNDYPDFFKRGTFVFRRVVERELEPDELAKIPERNRPSGPVMRNRYEAVSLPKLTTLANREEVLFAPNPE